MLFGHLASRFSTHPENLVTEAVAFIVNRSPAMREALRRLVGRTGIELPPLTTFRSQASDHKGNIPDLIGLDTMGTERLFIENKFWAGLTANQPAGYIKRLPADGGAVLVFVVPSKRLPIVWTELASSAMNRGMCLPPEQLAGDLRFARLPSSSTAPGASTVLAATTWNAVLESLDDAARDSGETTASADIAQLRSLCDMMDNAAFLPVRTEELTNLEVPQRLIGLADLVSDLSKKAVAEKIADSQGLKEGHTWYSTGRWLKIGKAEAWLGIDHKKWRRYGISPLWIRFSDSEYRRGPFVLEALKAWAEPRLFADGGRAFIPLTVLADVARETILEDLLEQLRRLHAALQSAPAMTITPP
jgi:hypothetical protein